jgi:hypothetical protein
MKVNYTTKIDSEAYWGPKNCYSTPEDSVEFCCEEMKKYWDDEISFHAIEKSLLPTVNIVVKYYNWGSDGDDKDWAAIGFCPFCAEKIECVEKERYQAVHTQKTIVRNEVQDKVTYARVSSL